MSEDKKSTQRCEMCLTETDDLIVDVMMHVCRQCWERTGKRQTSAYEKRSGARVDAQGLRVSDRDQDASDEPKSSGRINFMKSGDDALVCASPDCGTELESDWKFCPSCGRTKQSAYLTASGVQSTDRKDVSRQALAAAIGITILGISLVVGGLVYLLVGWTGLLDSADTFLVFAIGFAFGVLFGLVGFSMWLKFEGHRYGAFQP